MRDWILGNHKISLTVSGKDGALLGLLMQNHELILPAKSAFSLRFLNKDRDFISFSSSDFGDCKMISESDGGLLRRWSGAKSLPGLTVQSRIRFDGEAFRFRNAVYGVPADWELEMMDAPVVVVPEENELFWPKTDGVLISQPEKSNRWFQQLNAPSGLSYGIYPGACQMQFMASYSADGSRGIYFAADDSTHSTKLLEFNPDNGDPSRIRFRIECHCGHDGDQRNYELPFDLLLRPFCGDWRDACAIYRDWVNARLAGQFVRKAKWLEKNPVVVVLTVRGNGKINAEENQFSDYQNAFPRLQELATAFDSPVMALLMRWDQHGPWLPPYCWPPVGDLKSFYRLRDLLHESGNLFGVYCSGTSFTVKSLMNSYNCEEEYRKNHYDQYMAAGPRGDTKDVMPGIREGAHLCVTEEFGRNIILDQFRRMAEAKLDYIQFFDQNYGCVNYPCYSRSHHHPAQPGVWQTEVMKSLLCDMAGIADEVNPELLIGAESSAPIPYLNAVPFSDARSLHNWRYGIPCDGYAFVYHRYANNFLGNQCEMWQLIDCENAPDNLALRMTMGFLAGQFLSVTLRADGSIAWGAADDWSRPAPDQKSIETLVRNLNEFRKKYGEFLADGDLQKPYFQVTCGEYELPFRNGVVRKYPLLLGSSWSSPEGKKAHFLVNYRTVPETGSIAGEKPFHCSDGKTFSAGAHTVTIPPLTVRGFFPA